MLYFYRSFPSFRSKKTVPLTFAEDFVAMASQTTSSQGPGASGKSIPEGHAILAVPKKGRLNEKVMKMLDGAGLDYTRRERVDVAVCTNLPIVLVFLPASDIATFVGEGNVDLGITGQDHILESGVDVDALIELGFGKCSLSIQAPTVSQIKDVKSQLTGKRIATSFPKITADYFQKLDPSNPPHIREISGSVEAACGLGLADAVVDLVETGTTMRAAGLEEVEVIMKTQATLIANKSSKHTSIIELLKTRIEGYLTATRFMMISYNVSREHLAAAILITPGKRSPTVSPLEADDWCAVSSLVEKKAMAEVMDKLQGIGATDILCFAISNSRM